MKNSGVALKNSDLFELFTQFEAIKYANKLMVRWTNLFACCFVPLNNKVSEDAQC